MAVAYPTVRHRCCVGHSCSSTSRAAAGDSAARTSRRWTRRTSARRGRLRSREMIAKHRASPTCAACHAVMDPLAWRSRTSMRPACGAIAIATPAPRSTPLARCRMARHQRLQTICERALLRGHSSRQTSTQGLLGDATGLHLEHYNMPTVCRIARGAARERLRSRRLVQRSWGVSSSRGVGILQPAAMEITKVAAK